MTGVTEEMAPGPLMDIRTSYDSAAAAYAEHLAGELASKPLDRHLLNRFAEEVRSRGLVADVGCGPGHVAHYLHRQGVTVFGLDISPGMIRTARDLYPAVEFRIEDMMHMSASDHSLAGAVLFYSIVHFETDTLAAVFREVRRVLIDGGIALVSFHVGNEVVHMEDLFGAQVFLDFRFFAPEVVTEALRSANMHVLEHVEREPYAGAEYSSRRCYLLARAA